MQSIAFRHLSCFALLPILGDVPRPKLDDQITFRLSTADKQELLRQAEKLDRSHNWLARDIVIQWLNKRRRRAKAK